MDDVKRVLAGIEHWSGWCAADWLAAHVAAAGHPDQPVTATATAKAGR